MDRYAHSSSSQGAYVPAPGGRFSEIGGGIADVPHALQDAYGHHLTHDLDGHPLFFHNSEKYIR